VALYEWPRGEASTACSTGAGAAGDSPRADFGDRQIGLSRRGPRARPAAFHPHFSERIIIHIRGWAAIAARV